MCNSPLDGQAVGNALYGLKCMSSEEEQVRNMLASITIQIAKCKESLRVSEKAMALFGLQNMSSEHVEVLELLKVLTKQFYPSSATMSSSSVEHEHEHNGEILSSSTGTEPPMTAQNIAMSLYGLSELYIVFWGFA